MSKKKEALEELNSVPGVKARPSFAPRPDLNPVFEEMKAESFRKYPDTPDSYEKKFERWKDSMMRLLIQMQRESGVAVPSGRQAEDKLGQIYRDLCRKGLDFHHTNPGELVLAYKDYHG